MHYLTPGHGESGNEVKDLRTPFSITVIYHVVECPSETYEARRGTEDAGVNSIATPALCDAAVFSSQVRKPVRKWARARISCGKVKFENMIYRSSKPRAEQPDSRYCRNGT
jgi:hypothetical protein